MANAYDVAVLGATPAGYAAACRMAHKGLSVALLDGPRQSSECPLADWVSPEFFKLAGLPATLATKIDAQPFNEVVYHNSNLERQVIYPSRAKAGYLLETATLVKALRKAAEHDGVVVHTVAQRPRIELQEDQVRMGGTKSLHARVLILAQDRPMDALRELSLPLRSVPTVHLTTAGLDVPLKDRELKTRLAGTLHVVETPERTELGMYFMVGNTLHLRVMSSSRASGTRAAELSQMVQALQEKRLLPTDLPLDKAQGAVWYPPAGMALELETHVAKRALLCGSAGGFADTITGHTLLPSVKSALLAADVAMAALKSPDPQEALGSFKTLWRETLAEYLRPPNTSLQMLLPLLFANQKIVSRFTRALLYGENI